MTVNDIDIDRMYHHASHTAVVVIVIEVYSEKKNGSDHVEKEKEAIIDMSKH